MNLAEERRVNKLGGEGLLELLKEREKGFAEVRDLTLNLM
jgi:hypothetical protein